MRQSTRRKQQQPEMAGPREEDLLFKNVQDLRKRLQKTQKNLQSLHAFENGAREDASSDVGSTTSEYMPPLNLNDLSPANESQQSSRQHGRHGKGNHGNHRSVKGMAGRSVNQSSSGRHPSYSTDHPSFPGPSYASTPTKGTQQALVVAPPGGAGSSGSHLAAGQSVTQVENDTLRRKLHLVREENAKLVTQNHKLLTQLETSTYQLHHHNAKIAYLTQENQDYAERIPEFEERVVTLEAENEAQENALREAESRIEDGQRHFDELDNQLKHCKEHLKATRQELGQERKIRKRADHERDVALQNVEELQVSLDEFQRNSKEKLKKHQTGEEHLKESLRHADHEREELLDKNANLHTQIDDLQEELRQYQEKNVSAEEMRSEFEHQNLDLRTQLARLTQKIARLEGELQDAVLIRQENSALRRLVDQQHAQLEQAQREVGESHAHLVRLEEVASRLSMRETASNTHSMGGSDSGVSTCKAQSVSADGHQGDDEEEGSEADLNGSYLEALQLKDGAHGSSASGSLVADLRQQIAHKEAELQQVRTEMEAQAERSSRMVVVDSLRMELQAAIDRNSIAEKRSVELEQMISHLEEERTKHVTHIIHLEEKTADLEMMTTSLESRLSQRNSQVAELQKEFTEKSNQTTTLEREVRKKSLQIQSLERQLDEKVSEVSEQVTKVTDQEEELTQQRTVTEKLRGELEEKRKELATCKGTGDKLRDVHKEQMEEMEKQIELLEQKWEESQAQLKAYKKEVTTLRTDVAAKDACLKETKKELQQYSEQHEGAVGAMQRQVAESTERCRQLEGALLVCKEEVRIYLEQLEDNKDQHDLQVASRDDQILRLDVEASQLRQAVGEKDGQVSELLSALEERQNMLQTSNSRIGELEDLQTQLEAQVSNLEQELHREQATWQTEVTGMEKKLQGACTELEHRTMQTVEMTTTIKDLASEKKQLTEEVNDLERRLHDERRDADAWNAQTHKLEAEIRELRAHLNEKIEQVEEQDDQLQRLQDEVAEREKRFTGLDRELTKAEGDVEYLSAQVDEAHRQLEEVRADLEQRDELITGLKQNIRRIQDELRSRSREVEELDEALKERQWELQQRAAQVTQLDMTIKEHKADMEQHIIRLEGALKKTQIELQQKNKQISDLDHHVENLQEESRDKLAQLQQVDVMVRQQRTELESKTAGLQELQQLYDASRKSLEGAKEDGLEVTQQLRLAREAQQKLHLELTEVKRDAALSQRELDRVTHELDELTQEVQSKEDEVVELSDKLGKAKINEAQLETKNNSDTRKLTREMELLKEQHRQQIAELRDAHTQQVSVKDQESGVLRAARREAAHHQEALIEEIERARSEVTSLEGDLFACKDVIQAANETIVLKEAHIARLEAKIHGYERTNLRHAERQAKDGLTSSMNTHQRSSSESSMVLPRVSLQKSLKLVNQHQEEQQMQRSASDLSLTFPGAASRAVALLHNLDPEAQEHSLDSPRSTHSMASTDGVPSQGSISNFQLSPRSNEGSGSRKNSGNDLGACLNGENVDSFESMLKQVNQMYYNLNQNNTASAITPASSANMKAIRSRVFSDPRIRSGSASSSQSSISARSASNLTGAATLGLLHPNVASGFSSSRPISDSYMTMMNQVGNNNPSFTGNMRESHSMDHQNIGQVDGVLTLDVNQVPVSHTYVESSVENLLVVKPPVDAAHGSRTKHDVSHKEPQPQQPQMVAHTSHLAEAPGGGEGGGSAKISKMIERLSQRANMVASQMEAQAANFKNPSATEDIKPNGDDDDDDDDDTSSEDMDFLERDPETAIQRDMIMLDIPQ